MTVPPQPPAATRGKSASVAGAMVSGLAAYVFTIAAARVLGDVDYAPVGVMWTVQYLVLTVGLLSLEAWITREGRTPRAALRWVLWLSLALTAVTAVAAPSMLGANRLAWAAISLAICLWFGMFAVTRGLWAAEGNLTAYGLMTGGESVLRLLVAAVVLVTAPTALAVAATLPLGALLVSLPRALRSASRRRGTSRSSAGADDLHATLLPPGGPAATPPMPFLAATTTANAVLQLLLAGGPLFTAALGADPATTSVVFVTTTAARAPLVLVYSGLLARLLRAINRSPAELVAARTTAATVIAPGAILLAGAIGWAIGPTLVALAFGAALRPSPEFAGLTAAAVVAAILLLLANQVLIAEGDSASLWKPWALALLAAVAIAVTTAALSADVRAGLTTLTGMMVAGGLLVAPVRRATRAPQVV